MGKNTHESSEDGESNGRLVFAIGGILNAVEGLQEEK